MQPGFLPWIKHCTSLSLGERLLMHLNAGAGTQNPGAELQGRKRRSPRRAARAQSPATGPPSRRGDEEADAKSVLAQTPRRAPKEADALP